jgi:hypothetical protein
MTGAGEGIGGCDLAQGQRYCTTHEGVSVGCLRRSNTGGSWSWRGEAQRRQGAEAEHEPMRNREKAFPLHRVCDRIRACMGQPTWAWKTTAWSEPTGSGGLDRGGRVMAPTARSDSAQGTCGVTLPSGPHGLDWWRPWASSS